MILKRTAARVSFKDGDGHELKLTAKDGGKGRIGGKRRYIYTTIRINAVPYLYLIEDLDDHDVDKSILAPKKKFDMQKYFESEKVQASIVKQIKEIESKKTVESSSRSTEKNYQNNTINRLFYDDELVFFTQDQNTAVSSPIPNMCYGGGGTGKTLVSIAKLLIAARAGNSPYYVSQNPKLVAEIQRKLREAIQSYIESSYEEFILDEVCVNDNFTLIRNKSHIKKMLPHILVENEMQDIAVEEVLAEFEIISGCDEKKYVQGELSSKFKGKENKDCRAKLFEMYQKLQHEFRDVKYLKTWIEKDCQASIQNLDAGAILQEFIRLAGRCEKTYVEQGQADKRAYRESILLSFKRLQEHLADKKLVYAPFVPVPVTKYSEPVNKLCAKFASPATKAWDHKKVLEAEENLKNENERRKLIKENNIKQWIVRRHFGSKKDQDVDLVLREFTRLTTGDEKTYVESGIEQSEFNGPDKKDVRKKIFASFQALQNMLKANKLMYVPLTDLPAGVYYALIIKEMREEFERINKVSEIKFRTYEDLLLEEEEKQKNEKERRTLIRQKSQIKTLLKEELDRQKMSETTVDQVLAEFKLIECGHDKYVEHYPGDQFKGQVNQERRQKILSFYDKFKNDYKDESGLKSWFKGHITPQLPNQDFNLIWQELRIICGYSKEEYLKLGQRQSNFGG